MLSLILDVWHNYGEIKIVVFLLFINDAYAQTLAKC